MRTEHIPRPANGVKPTKAAQRAIAIHSRELQCKIVMLSRAEAKKYLRLMEFKNADEEERFHEFRDELKDKDSVFEHAMQFDVQCTVDGKRSFAIEAPQGKRLKLDSPEFVIDPARTYIAWVAIDNVYAETLVDGPFSKKLLRTQWVRRRLPKWMDSKGSTFAWPCIVAAFYKGAELSLCDSGSCKNEDVYVLRLGKKIVDPWK
jgi:hypothetical protein